MLCIWLHKGAAVYLEIAIASLLAAAWIDALLVAAVGDVQCICYSCLRI